MKRPQKEAAAAAEAEPGPALMTPRRFAAELERLGLDLARVAGRLLALEVYLGSQPDRPLPVGARALTEVAEGLAGDVAKLARVRGVVLAGRIEITAGADESSWKERRPLLAAIEAKGAPGPPPDAPAGSPPEAPAPAPSVSRTWLVFPAGRKTPLYAVRAPSEAAAEVFVRDNHEVGFRFHTVRDADGLAVREKLWVVDADEAEPFTPVEVLNDAAKAFESQQYEAEARRSGRRSARKLKKAPVLNGAAGEGGDR